ncbi:twin-arginine translocase TatA/TatE family subunit [Candidatus Nitrospira allomarina]|uniref:Sec-independent protein translocase protein TatA n=1 Tax=Candidatus Nitrospira allomarina TaxID=3020900 RepID=A0AA96JS28_9BACT|nr:twin-arginine translocase TatA/TatE family subunit [Candidatus Nitrospira allomarina]
MFGSLGFTELILILMIVLIIFGAGKLPQLGEGVGKAIKGFKKSVQEAEAYDLDPQVQVENTASANQGNAQPQISQPMHTAPLETGSPVPPPAAVQPAQQEQVPASSKA